MGDPRGDFGSKQRQTETVDGTAAVLLAQGRYKLQSTKAGMAASASFAAPADHAAPSTHSIHSIHSFAVAFTPRLDRRAGANLGSASIRPAAATGSRQPRAAGRERRTPKGGSESLDGLPARSRFGLIGWGHVQRKR